jgi:hypothetical protein
MTTLTLLVKASKQYRLKHVEDLLNSAFEDLDVKFEVLGNAGNGWVQVSVSGEDEAVAKSYIVKEIGVCPASLANVENSAILKGYITNLEKSTDNLTIDVGVFEPKIVYASVPLASLQAQLVDGRKVDFNKIVELYGLAEGLPLTIKVTNINSEEKSMQAELAAEQVEKYGNWKDSLLDRLITLGSARDDVDSMLERTRLNRDVIDVEALGSFEYALTCKLGTDAAGLIFKIGRYMKNARLIAFNSKKIIDFLDE